MGRDNSAGLMSRRTHFIEKPEGREVSDRRKYNCFIANDKRSGIACRRREKQRELERRWYIRYTVNPGTFVVLRRPLRYKLWRSREVAAPIVDISIRGVSIQSKVHKMCPFHRDTLSIIAADKISKVDNIHYELVSARKAISVSGNGNTRRLGFKFADLSRHQKWQLLFLLEKVNTFPIQYEPNYNLLEIRNNE